MNPRACPEAIHVFLKSSYYAFVLGTSRLTDFPDRESYQDLEGDIRQLRICRFCSTTIAMKIDDYECVEVEALQ